MWEVCQHGELRAELLVQLPCNQVWVGVVHLYVKKKQWNLYAIDMLGCKHTRGCHDLVCIQ